MKKLLNPVNLIYLGVLLFGIALTDLLITDRDSFEHLRWWGKIATILFVVDFVGILFILFGLPLINKKK